MTERTVGDQGQRYEVRYIDSDGSEKVLGWTSRADGGNLMRGLTVHPVWKFSRVVDRRALGEEVRAKEGK